MRLLGFDEFLSEKFSLLIDARSPAEYDDLHIKNALNFYSLNDEERERVGTLYNHNKFEAKLLGAALICHNASLHLDAISKHIKPYNKLGIYCSRGGQRSGALGHILSEIGYEVYKLEGGFKNYKANIARYLEQDLYERFSIKLISLSGNTASGKTRLLSILKPSIDLEALARHLGSSFGGIKGEQPKQKNFDVELFYKLRQNSGLVFVEAESRNIGKITLPLGLHKAMQEAFIVSCSASFDIRVSRCVEDYKNIDKSIFFKALNAIKAYTSKAFVDNLALLYERDDLESVAALLLSEYYDKVYKKPLKIDLEINLDNLEKARDELLALKAHLEGRYHEY